MSQTLTFSVVLQLPSPPLAATLLQLPLDFAASLSKFAMSCCNHTKHAPQACHKTDASFSHGIGRNLPDCDCQAFSFIGAEEHSTYGHVSTALGAVGILLNLLTIVVLVKQKGTEIGMKRLRHTD